MKSSNKILISLDKFINNSLYDKKKGYYMKKNPFGKKGDFITSPNISILFSEMILIWIVLFWENLKKPKKINIVELGSGDGEMLFQILKASEKFPIFKNSCKFYIFEKSPHLIKIQKNRLKNYKLNWIKDIKKITNYPTLFIGNEFFDALPIKQFIKKKNNWFDKYVALKSMQKKIIDIKINIKKIEKKIGINISKNQKFIEFSPSSFDIIKKISKIINKYEGGLLIIDYGYFGQKMLDTLQTIKNHKKINIFKKITESDITYMLNFVLIEKIIKKFNLKLNGLSSQREFLINLGILDRAEIISKKVSFSQKANIYFRLKRLIDRNQMGELFKVMFVSSKKNNFKVGF